MSREPDEALEVLREVWSSQGQTAADLDDESGTKKSCKKMAEVGFDGFTAGEEDPKVAWRARLQREGKLGPAVGSVRDLVMGTSDSLTESR